MALWKDVPIKPPATPAAEPAARAAPPTAAPAPAPAAAPAPAPAAAPAPAPAAAAPRPAKPMSESVVAAGLTFEGKVEGSGHVRISGRFKGDVAVDGTLTIDAGAHLSGSVRASTVIIGGELEGNVEKAQRVELQQTGSVTGDIAAGSMTVASGAKMSGRVDFGSDGSSRERK